MTMLQEMRQFAESHRRNGERKTADLLDRAADYLFDLEHDRNTLALRLKKILKRQTLATKGGVSDGQG